MAGLVETDIRTADLNGITLAYRVIGTGHPLLLINGFASPMDTWNPPLLAALARHFRVIIFDNRGTGYSTATDEPFSIRLFANDTLALMDALEIPISHVLGLSMGAAIAQELVLAHPDRVDPLILACGTCGGDQMVMMAPEIWQQLSDKSGTGIEVAGRMFSVLFPAGWLATHDPWQYCPAVHETTSEESAKRQAEALFRWPGTYGRLPAIRCPVLVLTGADDAVIPPENSRILARQIPGARLIEIPGAGHGLQYQCPDAFSRTVLEFLKRENH